MAYADGIRAADTVTLDTIADLIENICTASGSLAFTAWTPTTAANGGGTWTSITNASTYAVIGDLVICYVHIFGTITGTVTSITFTLPGAVAASSHNTLEMLEGGLSNIVPASTKVQAASDTVTAWRYDDAAISAGTTRGVSGWVFYSNT